MWQSPSQKNRGTAVQKGSREQTRSSLRIKRVMAEIRTAEIQTETHSSTVGSARILLNDLSPKGVGIYCSKPFSAGQEVSIVLSLKDQFYLRGKVIFCREQDSKTQVISQVPHYFRIGIKFLFENAEEEERVAQYCKTLLETVGEQAAA
jgi:hypothetical protein